MITFVSENFNEGELVAPVNMTNLFQNPASMLSAYFPETPCLGSGIGALSNKFGQVGTTNVFNMTDGVVRFVNQINPNTSTELPTFATVPGGAFTITVPTGASPQYYVVAQLTFTVENPNQVTNEAAILTTAMTLAQIASAANPDGLIPLFAITTLDGTVYTVKTDINCAINYGAPNVYPFFNRKNSLPASYEITDFDMQNLLINSSGSGSALADASVAINGFYVGFTFFIQGNASSTTSLELVNVDESHDNTIVFPVGDLDIHTIIFDGFNWYVDGIPQNEHTISPVNLAVYGGQVSVVQDTISKTITCVYTQENVTGVGSTVITSGFIIGVLPANTVNSITGNLILNSSVNNIICSSGYPSGSTTVNVEIADLTNSQADVDVSVPVGMSANVTVSWIWTYN